MWPWRMVTIARCIALCAACVYAARLRSLHRILVVTLTEIETFRTQHHSLGRLLFCAGMLALGLFAWRMLHPRTGVLDRFLASTAGGWLDRLRPIWFWA